MSDTPELRDPEEIENLREEFLAEVHSAEVLRQQAADERDALRERCEHLETALKLIAYPDGVVRAGDPHGRRIDPQRIASSALLAEPERPTLRERNSVYNWLLNKDPSLGPALRAAEGLE